MFHHLGISYLFFSFSPKSRLCVCYVHCANDIVLCCARKSKRTSERRTTMACGVLLGLCAVSVCLHERACLLVCRYLANNLAYFHYTIQYVYVAQAHRHTHASPLIIVLDRSYWTTTTQTQQHRTQAHTHTQTAHVHPSRWSGKKHVHNRLWYCPNDMYYVPVVSCDGEFGVHTYHAVQRINN